MEALLGNPLFLPFAGLVAAALVVDLRVAGRRRSDPVPTRTALGFTALWILWAMVFGYLIRVTPGVHPGESIGTDEGLVTYLTGYLVEYTLSIDNVFAFTLVFAALNTPKEARHRALAWGIVLSIVMRLGMILLGASLVERFELDTSRRFKEYSKGNKQKVGVIIALQHRPELLVLDEPTSGLDPLVQATFFETLRDSVRDGATIFLSSHILSEVEKNCDYVGGEFAEEARKMHRGESEYKGIYGETTKEEAEALADEGIDVASIPWVPRAD